MGARITKFEVGRVGEIREIGERKRRKERERKATEATDLKTEQRSERRFDGAAGSESQRAVGVSDRPSQATRDVDGVVCDGRSLTPAAARNARSPSNRPARPQTAHT
jgi:hypothetical protein